MYPRWKYSPEYGAVLYTDTRMVHECPGQWSFTYNTNRYGYRGVPVPISNDYGHSNVVVLGDSYAFGHGVNDGDEFPAIMRRLLEGSHEVINLGVGGYGLTQEIRRFYEFGRLYDPDIVVLQFCNNDPTDCLVNRVTGVEDGRFAFKDSNNPIGWTKEWLSRSLIQKSQLYNVLRENVFDFFWRRTVEKGSGKSEGGRKPGEGLYIELLDVFARDLRRRGVRLIMISVNGELDDFQQAREKVAELETEGVLDYVEVAPWFDGEERNYSSPEGHRWGELGHEIVGRNLARYILDNYGSESHP